MIEHPHAISIAVIFVGGAPPLIVLDCHYKSPVQVPTGEAGRHVPDRGISHFVSLTEGWKRYCISTDGVRERFRGLAASGLTGEKVYFMNPSGDAAASS